MVGDSADIEVNDLEFGDVTVTKLVGHEVTPTDVLAVLANEPQFFKNLPGRSGSHVMLGPNMEDRFFYIVLVESSKPGTWNVVTGYHYSRRRALRFYRRES